MCDQHRGVFLKHRRNGHERQVLLHELDGATPAEVEVQATRHHQLHLVHLRPALANGHLQAVLRVQPGGESLVIAAVFRLGQPVEPEADRIIGVRPGVVEQHAADRQDQSGGKPSHAGLDSRSGHPILHNGAAIGEWHG